MACHTLPTYFNELQVINCVEQCRVDSSPVVALDTL